MICIFNFLHDFRTQLLYCQHSIFKLFRTLLPILFCHNVPLTSLAPLLFFSGASLMTCSHEQPDFSTRSSVFIVTRWKIFCYLPHVPILLKTPLYGICLMHLTWQIFGGCFVKFDKKFNVYLIFSLFIEHNCCKLKAIFILDIPLCLLPVHYISWRLRGRDRNQ